MTALAYTTGNPANLTGGTNASMNDIQGPFNDLKTYINGASIADTQLESPLSAAWRPILTADASVATGAVAATNYWFAGQLAVASGSGANVTSGVPVLWLPSTAADVAVGGRTARLRLRTVLVVNATAPGVTVTPGFYPISAFAGGSSTITPTLGAVVLTTSFVTPAGGSGNQGVSSTVDLSSLSATTTYCFGVAVSGSVAASSVCVLHMALEMRHT